LFKYEIESRADSGLMQSDLMQPEPIAPAATLYGEWVCAHFSTLSTFFQLKCLPPLRQFVLDVMSV
jgi:hypothetical protein